MVERLRSDLYRPRGQQPIDHPATIDAIQLLLKASGVSAPFWRDSKHLWEADHIVPVVEGGGGCGLDGYRTLCLICHRKATAALAARRAAERREEAYQRRLARWTGASSSKSEARS